MLNPGLEEFKHLATKGNVVPVYRELLADMETPVSVFKKLNASSEYAFLLESVEQGEKLGRYSFLGADPAAVLRVRGKEQEIIAADGEKFETAETPVATLRSLLARYKPVVDPKLPPFFGGAVGYMSYDTVRYYERIPDNLPDDLQLPDCLIMIADSLIVFDHVKRRMILIVNARIDNYTDTREAYQDAITKLNVMRSRIVNAPVIAAKREEEPADPKHRFDATARRVMERNLRKNTDNRESVDGFRTLGSLNVQSNMRKEDYVSAVNKAKEYIAAGDIFQVVYSQRFETEITCDPFDIYRALRAVNPSPYMFYLKCGSEFQLAGSSPEILSKLSQKKVTVRPIAGTRRRGVDAAEDVALEKDLLADEKERAEHVMLVDLGRNDVGRVSKFGTVTVTDFMTIERYSHVMHIVSNVEGELAPGHDALDVISATFPAGTLSGAPKIRAMEIIDELEKSRRGPYGGAVVYLGFNGEMDSCITIRTAVIKGNKVYVQAGGGIVADSDPQREYMECVNKAKGMLTAVQMAEEGLE
ncbi:MAG: anthranilate synthase component I [Candidatus Sumerlaeota bacterium]